MWAHTDGSNTNHGCLLYSGLHLSTDITITTNVAHPPWFGHCISVLQCKQRWWCPVLICYCHAQHIRRLFPPDTSLWWEKDTWQMAGLWRGKKDICRHFPSQFITVTISKSTHIRCSFMTLLLHILPFDEDDVLSPGRITAYFWLEKVELLFTLVTAVRPWFWTIGTWA